MLTSAMAALSGIVVQKILWTAVPHTNWGLHCIRRTDSRRRKLTKSGETVPLLPWWNTKNHAELSNISIFSYFVFLQEDLLPPIIKPEVFQDVRWMVKAIYVLKHLMFRKHMKLTLTASIFNLWSSAVHNPDLFKNLDGCSNTVWLCIKDLALIDDPLHYNTVN
jgi:hypothetical protein